MLIGNLTRDPQIRQTPNGSAVVSFSIATNRSFTSGEEKKEQVEFHNIVGWAKLAEICERILKKGSRVYLEGRLQTRDWKSQDGQERRTTEIVIDNMILLANGKDAQSAPAQTETEEVEDVDIPF